MFKEFPLKHLLLIVSFLLLAGCKSTPGIYNTKNVNTNQLAHLSSGETSMLHAGLRAFIFSVYNDSGKKIIGSSSALSMDQDRWDDVHLEAGTYKIVAICTSGNSFAYPTTKITVESMTKYHFECIPEFEKNFLGLKEIKSMKLDIKKVVGNS